MVQVHESDGAFAAALVALLAGALDPSPKLVALLQVSYVEEWRAVRPLRFGDLVLGSPGLVERRFRRFKAPLHVLLGCLTAWLADRILAPSARTAQELERDYGVSGVEVLPNVTGGVAAVGEEEGTATLQVTQAADLLFVGRLRIRKGVEVLLHAIAMLAEREVWPRLRIVGEGEHRLSLERLAGRLGLAEQVEFAGKRDASAVRAELLRSRALVVPSTYEGMPLVVLEAMSVGLPVVATSVSGIPEVVLDGETGWLVSPEDPAELAAALLQLLVNPAEGVRRGENGRRRVEQEFHPGRACELWEKILLEERI